MDANGETVQPLLDPEFQPDRRRGLRVTFSDLEFLLPSNVERGELAVVLRRMSGYFNAGEMTAVMGPSGCGKSMLMDVLSGRRVGGITYGNIRYASQVPSTSFLRECTGYVEQFSSLIENLTVFEMLMYTAELKRPSEEPWSEKKTAVEDLIQKLALVSCRDIKIGDPHLDRGISGGQGKRVNIGVALITNPLVLYMDEPISGLDSYTANEVMEVVKSLVSDGMTLCATLHSPTPFTFGLFDRIILLLQGEMVFFGAHGDVSEYFESLSVGPFHPNESTAEWLTGIIVKADQEESSTKLIEAYNQSDLRRKNEDLVKAYETEDVEGEIDLLSDTHAKAQVNPFWFSIKVLLLYRTLKNYASSTFWITRSVDKSVLVLLLATMYHRLGTDFSFENWGNVSALMFIWTGFSATGALVYVPRLVIERWVFYREQRDGLYPVISYFLVKLVEEYIVAFLLSLAFCSILWYAIELQGSFWNFFFTFFGMFCSSIVLALLFGAIAPNMDIANAFFPCYLITLMFYAGYLLLPDSIPEYLVWYSKIDFLKYSYGAYMVNHFRSDRAQNSEHGVESEMFLEIVGLDDVDVETYIGALYLFVVCFSLIAYLAMSYVRFGRKA